GLVPRERAVGHLKRGEDVRRDTASEGIAARGADAAEENPTASAALGQVVDKGGAADGRRAAEEGGIEDHDKATPRAVAASARGSVATDRLIPDQGGVAQHEGLEARKNAAAIAFSADAGIASGRGPPGATLSQAVLHGAAADREGAFTAYYAAAPGKPGGQETAEDEEPAAGASERLVAAHGGVGHLSVHQPGLQAAAEGGSTRPVAQGHVATDR